MSLTANDPRHGSYNGYHNHGCRCGPCTTANTAYYREKAYDKDVCDRCGNLKNRKAEICQACRNVEISAPHGSETRYRGKNGAPCRCDLCRAAASAARKERRHANPEATRAHGRLYKQRYRQSKRAT